MACCPQKGAARTLRLQDMSRPLLCTRLSNSKMSAIMKAGSFVMALKSTKPHLRVNLIFSGTRHSGNHVKPLCRGFREVCKTLSSLDTSALPRLQNFLESDDWSSSSVQKRYGLRFVPILTCASFEVETLLTFLPGLSECLTPPEGPEAWRYSRQILHQAFLKISQTCSWALNWHKMRWNLLRSLEKTQKCVKKNPAYCSQPPQNPGNFCNRVLGVGPQEKATQQWLSHIQLFQLHQFCEESICCCRCISWISWDSLKEDL